MNLFGQLGDSGIQVMMVLGVVLMVTTTAPQLGRHMLLLGIVAWVIYNIPNIGRQF